MESFLSSSFALGILVEKEIMVHTVDNVDEDPVASHRPSVVSVVHSVPGIKKKTRTLNPQETVSSLTPGKMVPRPDVKEERQESLTEFFRSRPPPGNFMSQPDNLSVSSGDHGWNMFKVFRKSRKRKGPKKRPPLIQLPDSAISSRTTDGHRYIAIAVPYEQPQASPVHSAHSQYPVSQSMEAEFHRAVDSRHLPRHSLASDRGMNIQNLAIEGHELPSMSAAHPGELTRLAPPPRKVSLLSTVLSEGETPPGKGKEPDKQSGLARATTHIVPMSALGSVRKSHYVRRRSTSQKRQYGRQAEGQKISEPKGLNSDRVLRVVEIPPQRRTGRSSQEKQPARDTNQSTSDSHAVTSNIKKPNRSPGPPPPRVISANPLATLELPTRTSSKRGQTITAVPSELSNATSWRPTRLRRTLSTNDSGDGRGGGFGAGTDPRGSFAESLVTDSSPQLLQAETAMAFQSVPIVVRPPSQPKVESPLNLNFPTPPSSKAHRSLQADLLAPPHLAEKGSSRKDRVRQRKLRDIERLKAQIRQIQSPTSHFRPGIMAESLWPESPILGQFNREVGSSSLSKPLSTSRLKETGPTKHRLQLDASYPSPESVPKKRRARSKSAPIVTSSSSPSPVGTPPMPWEGSTSYYRRKERQAERDEDEARKLRYVAKALAEEKENQDQISRQELLRRYERLEESRDKDMEKRLYRLEKNGEVLMKSMVSMMEILQKLVQDQYVLQQNTPTSSPAPQSHRPQRNSVPERSQSARTVRGYDGPTEALRLQGHQGGEIQGGERGTFTRLRGDVSQGDLEAEIGAHQLALGALQEQLRSQSRQNTPVPYVSGRASPSNSSMSSSNKARNLLTLDMETARYGLDQREAALDFEKQAEEAKTPLGESEVFNLL
ncbi:hypothetical protein F4819DRAFT_394569 [Hypoxylon fuscum]|nr:hypothetical protein F4819DRAFT_394569 [Hypoxylon fuscum]